MAVIKADPTSKKVKADEEKLLRLVGECVTPWAFVDRELFNLCYLMLGTTHVKTAAVYYSFRALSERLNLTHNIAKQHFTPARLKRWGQISKRIRSGLEMRSIVAHQPLLRIGVGRGKRAIYQFSIHIEPNEAVLGKTYKGLRGHPNLSLRVLSRHVREVERLEKDLATFRRRLPKQREGGTKNRLRNQRGN